MYSQTFLLLLLLTSSLAQNFQDVSLRAGIDHSMGPRKKYGGPSVADLNSDGHPDLLFCHHDKYVVEVYINNGRGAFKKHPFRYFNDVHGIVPFRHTAFTKHMRFTISPGGSAGTKPANAKMYEYRFDNGSIIDVTAASGLEVKGGRGRTALYINLRRGQYFRPDVIFTNAQVIPGFEPQQFGYQNRGRGKFQLKFLKGFSDNLNEWISVADVDNDGKLEVLSYHDFAIFKITSPFTFKDISAKVLPQNLDYRGIVAVAELDYDGDGDFDLYLARTNTGSMDWLRRDPFYDYLLENRGGVYVDVSAKAGIPRDAESRGVTAADFNNDGKMDIFITRYQKRDLLLINKGDGTFRAVRGKIPRASNVRGDSAQAVDYDSDGRVDLIVGQGDRDKEEYGGVYRVFRNKLKLTKQRRFVLVRVGIAPDRGATSLHAVVTVTGNGGFKAVRRVGSPGTAVSTSYIELIHVGIGSRSKVDVKVRWVHGKTKIRRNVPANSKIVMGIVAR